MLTTRIISRATLTRFLPTGAFLMAVGLVPVMLSGVEINPWAPAIVLGQVVSSAFGYWAALLLLRGPLDTDTPVLGRPGIVAGVVAPVVNMLALMALRAPHTRLVDAAACAIGGGILACCMYFPWLSQEPASASVQPTVGQPELMGGDIGGLPLAAMLSRAPDRVETDRSSPRSR